MERWRGITFFDRPLLPLAHARRSIAAPVLEAHDRVDTHLTPEEKEFLDWLLARANVDVHHYRAAPLQRRIAACLRALRVKTIAQARAKLDQHPELLPPAISAVLVGVTSFFRDTATFSALPRLLRERATGRLGLDVWSAGCSDGAELYSVAMLLDQVGVLDCSRLVGTDCRVQAVEHARRAAYSAQDLASLPTEWRQKYLIPVGSLNCLTPRLRERTIWRVENIFDRPASEKFDVVLCRNVSIYMTPATSMRLWRLLDESLRPGGLLVVGRAERPCRQLHYERVGECVFAKKEGHR